MAFMLRLEEIHAFLKARTNGATPVVGIICGSGLSGLASKLEDPLVVPYNEIPGFPETTVAGHHGELVFGTLNGFSAVCMKGRFHSYEGHGMEYVTLPVRVFRMLGVKLLVVTNAAGGLNRSFNVGDIMVIQDHFALPCLAGKHPLVGPNMPNFGPRFVAVSDTYDPFLEEVVLQTAEQRNVRDKIRPKGTYCFVSGPTYETPAESRFLLSAGGDAVGMSTIPEVIVARHCGMAVLGLSLITNKVVMPGDEGAVHATHEEVLAATVRATAYLEDLVQSTITHEKLGSYVDSLPSYDHVPSAAYTRSRWLRAAGAAAGVLGVLAAGAFVLGRSG